MLVSATASGGRPRRSTQRIDVVPAAASIFGSLGTATFRFVLIALRISHEGPDASIGALGSTSAWTISARTNSASISQISSGTLSVQSRGTPLAIASARVFALALIVLATISSTGTIISVIMVDNYHSRFKGLFVGCSHRD